MSSVRRQLLLNAFKLFDLALLVVSFGLATLPVLYESGGVSFAHMLSMRVKVQNFLLFFAFMMVWHFIFSAMGLYRSHRLSGRRAEAIRVVKATTLAALFVGVAKVFFDLFLVTPVFLVTFWIASTVITIAGRLLLRYGLHRVRTHSRNLRCMLIVGTNPRAVEFARRIESRPELGYRILGFADEEWAGTDEFRKTGYPIVCDLENFADFLRDSVVDEVVMALPVRSQYYHASRIVANCEEQGIIMRFLSNLFDLKLARTQSEDFEGHAIVTLYTGASWGWPMVAKRILDFCAAFVILVLLAPVLLIAAILIKLTSPGPVFFVQKRLGLNKRRFPIFKFRTMVADAEKRIAELEEFNEVSGPVFKIKDDPRITAVGRFLRKTSIDELPQLLNVLRGEMSLVGPRPLPVRDYEGFDQDFHRRRFSVRPGITCLWQVNGRSSVSFDKWMELDMEYIDRWSLWLDFKILARTIPAVLRGSGAA